MDEQGLDAVVLYPTLGCGVEQALRFDVPATMASLTAFNRWLEDDWGYSYQDRIIAAPMISLADPDAAIVEIDRVLAHGARLVHVRPAPVPTGGPNGRSLGDPLHDPVWAHIAAAGIPVAFHLGDSGYNATLVAAVGRPRGVRAVPQPGPAAAHPHVRPGDPRHHGEPDRARRVHPPPRPAAS